MYEGFLSIVPKEGHNYEVSVLGSMSTKIVNGKVELNEKTEARNAHDVKAVGWPRSA